jgi:hypothetical protein
MDSVTWIKYMFHFDKSIIEFTVPTYVIDQWIEEKTPINTLRRNGVVLEFREI